MKFFKKLLGYILVVAGPVIGTVVSSKTGAAVGTGIGTAISGVGGRILHNAEPPIKK